MQRGLTFDLCDLRLIIQLEHITFGLDEMSLHREIDEGSVHPIENGESHSHK